MRITRVAFAFFAIGFLAGSFERAAGSATPSDPQANGRAATWTPQSRAPRSWCWLRSGRSEAASRNGAGQHQSSADSTLEAAARPGLGRRLQPSPMATADGLPLDARATPPLNPDLQRRRLVGKADAERADQADAMSKRPAPISLRRWTSGLRRVGSRTRANARTPATARTQEFIMPFERGRVTSLFHQGRYHPAIDLAGSLGSPVHSTTRRQRVTFAGWRGGYGNAVITRDEYGRTHLYGHLLRICDHGGQCSGSGPEARCARQHRPFDGAARALRGAHQGWRATSTR